ncbi:hypothetical protein [Novosphingobium sp. Fuku2-ISO-50]|uniref:hypothetical protein n=1 Tax=Novosphingobium sp. Fuku2-ISO-50 TaxID=1739114 RepID=UPI00076C8557|nr:hypothetical protein [Novosphingobium sp. Fuku2-ISO-50]KUR75345.1 hypothetical protein AQZ50_15930 [Novosphingobium sp. Fuku2-ISO-50]
MRYLLLPVLVLGLSDCAMFQSNVKGGFSCGAARGTCAPSTTIDDAALHAIDAHKADPDAPGSSAIARDDAKPGLASTDADTGPALGALKVVYPAWRDGSGHVHKRTVAYVNVDAPGLVAADSTPRALDNPSRTNLLAIAETAPDLALVSSAPSPASVPEPSVQPQPSATTATPIGAIQTQVRDILAKAPKPTIGKTVPTPPSPAQGVPTGTATTGPATTGPATTGGTFPPQGE